MLPRWCLVPGARCQGGQRNGIGKACGRTLEVRELAWLYDMLEELVFLSVVLAHGPQKSEVCGHCRVLAPA